jgi:hypothetical protein
MNMKTKLKIQAASVWLLAFIIVGGLAFAQTPGPNPTVSNVPVSALPGLTGDVTAPAGSNTTTYNNSMPVAKGGTGTTSGAPSNINFGMATNFGAGATLYFGQSQSGATDSQWVLISKSGTLSNLYSQFSGSPGVGQTFTITLNKGTVATALTCSMTGGSITCNDSINTVSVVAGDFLSIKAVASASSNNSGSNFFSVKFTPN